MSKTMKKLLSIILAILMIVSAIPVAFAADGNGCGVTDCAGTYTNGICSVCGGYEAAQQVSDTYYSELNDTHSGYYAIENAGQLYWFASQVNAGRTAINAVLTQNIDLNPGYIFSSDGTVTKDGAAVTGGWRRWTPIGATYSNSFKGTFDGMFHTVSGMYCNGLNYFGLFAYSGGHITRVGVENGYITGREYLAGICGYSNGKITKCWNSVTIVGNTAYSSTQMLGGIVGSCAKGNIQDCYNIGSISGYRYAGGIVGYFGGNIKPLLSNCYNMGTVSASTEYGSIFGKLTSYYAIENCYYLGETETDSQGGTTVMTAEQFASGAVTYNLNEGVTDGSQTWYQTCGEGYPAFSGKTVYVITEKCYVGTDIIDYTNVPQPKAGHNYQNGICINEREDGTPCGAYEECVQNAEGYYEIVNAGQLYAFAELVNDGEAGANAILLADITINQSVLDENGNLQNAASLKKWTPIGNYYGDVSYTGTFDGNHKSVSGVYCTDAASEVAFIHKTNGCKVKNLTIKDSYFSGDENSAGIVGKLVNGSISNCHSVNNVIIANNYAAGGIVGTAEASVIESCSNSSYVKVVGSSSRVGGVVGLLSRTGQVSNCYNTGTIEGPAQIGGIVGTEFEAADRTIINCYNIGKIIVNGTEASGYGISGNAQTTITFSNCYYLADSETDSHNGTTYMRAEDFASGEVAYKLGSAWGQNIDNDETNENWPVLSGATVYYGYFSCAEDATAIYTNDSTASATKLAHSTTSEDDKAATCSGKAYCSVCKQEYGDFDKDNHDTVDVPAKAKTCTTAGWDAYEYCKDCTYSTYEEIPASHNIETVEAKAPTCTDISWEAYEYCKDCTYSTYEEIPASGHTDADGDYLCDNGCGYEYEKPADTTPDGVPLTIDVTDVDRVYIGSEYDYYDEDGYILTGSSESAIVSVEESCDLTLKDVTLAQLRFAYAPNGSVMNITLEGTNEVTFSVMLASEHLIFEGSDNATFKASNLGTAGNDGTVTVNGGNIVLEGVTYGNVSTIDCADFIINGGTVTASNNNIYTIEGPVKLNGGTLNIINTSAEYEAIHGDITVQKGALLTVSGTYGLVRNYYDILMADGLAENNAFFVRYDTESEFVPVSDIKAALDGKTYAEIKIDAHEHDYSVGGICVCGHELEKPVTPDEPDTPDEPTDVTCDHLCHKSGFMGFIWKIIRFFQKLFGIQQYCDCGITHW